MCPNVWPIKADSPDCCLSDPLRCSPVIYTSLALTSRVVFSQHLDEHRRADEVGHCGRHGFHRDGDHSEDPRLDGNEDGRSALTPHRHMTNTGHGEALIVREDKLEGVAVCNNHHDLTTKTERIHPDHIKQRSDNTTSVGENKRSLLL